MYIPYTSSSIGGSLGSFVPRRRRWRGSFVSFSAPATADVAVWRRLPRLRRRIDEKLFPPWRCFVRWWWQRRWPTCVEGCSLPAALAWWRRRGLGGVPFSGPSSTTIDSCSGVDGGVGRSLYRSSGSGGAAGGRPRRWRWRIFLVSTTAGLLLFGEGVQDGPGYGFLAPGGGVLADGGGVSLLQCFEVKVPMYIQRPSSGRAESAAAGSCGFNMSWPSSALVAGGFVRSGGGGGAANGEGSGSVRLCE